MVFVGIISFLFATFLPISADEGMCPVDWIYYNCSCFSRTNTSSDWAAAWKACTEYKSKLMVADDVYTLSFLKGNFPHSWIGVPYKESGNGTIRLADISFLDENFKNRKPINCLSNGTTHSNSCNVLNLPAICRTGLGQCKPFFISSEPSVTTMAATQTMNTSPMTLPFSIPGNVNTHVFQSRNSTLHEKWNTLQKIIEDIKKNLTMNKRALSSFERKLISAEDSRRSSKGMGAVAMFVICIFPCLCIISDCSYVSIDRKHSRNRKRTRKLSE